MHNFARGIKQITTCGEPFPAEVSSAELGLARHKFILIHAMLRVNETRTSQACARLAS